MSSMRSERLCSRVASSRALPSSVGPVPSSMCRVAQMAPSPGPSRAPGLVAPTSRIVSSLSAAEGRIYRGSRNPQRSRLLCVKGNQTRHTSGRYISGGADVLLVMSVPRSCGGRRSYPLGLTPSLGDNASRDALHPATLQERSASSRWRRVVRASRRPPRPTSPSRRPRTFPLPVAPTRANVDGRRLPAAATTRRNPAHDPARDRLDHRPR